MEPRTDLPDLARKMHDGLDERTIDRVTTEVDAILDLLDDSPLAATLREQDTRAYFEMPFTWDWNGAAVHGAIDLVYRSGGNWRLVDFKTDELRGRPLAVAAEPYLPQLALYASALEQATRRAPGSQSALSSHRRRLHAYGRRAG